MSGAGKIKAYAVTEPGAKLAPWEYEVGALTGDEVQIRVEYCGICHSDISMANNDWGLTKYPLVPGHEVVGIVEAVGPDVRKLKEGVRVGLGWHAGYCGQCKACSCGDENLCGSSQPTIVAHHGGFANAVRASEKAVIPIPEGCNPATVGPLLCGGITVFTPLVEYKVQATDRIGVVGVGGLGHMALQFLKEMGCETTAFTSNMDKADFVRKLGATHVVDSTKPEEIMKLEGQFTMILVTVNVELNWAAYITALAPRGRLHLLGAIPTMNLNPFQLLMGMKQVSGSPVGNPHNIDAMLKFCARHKIEPMVEEFPISEVNTAIEKVHTNKIRFRGVLKL